MLIDADKIIEDYESCADMFSDDELDGIELVIEWIKDAPTVCDIDVIRAEIDFHATTFIKGKRYIEKDFALDIIDKHFKGHK